jgi:1-acyl-sn-glycerol-3-phosphate acyltransferase
VGDTIQVHVEPVRESSGFGHALSRLRSYLILAPLVWIYTIILGGLSLLSSFFDRNGEIQHRFARVWARVILGTLGGRVTVVGLDGIDISRPHVYVVNHLSALDIPVLYLHLPFQFRILAKSELFRYPFMGWHLSRSGQIPVDLENPKKSIRSLNRAVEAVRNGMPLVIFPEGGRSAHGQLQPFMGGAFFAAIRAKVDVVPMALIGTYEMLKMNTWHIKPRPLRLLVGKAISTSGLSVRDTEAVTERAREAIAGLYYPNATVPDLHKQNQVSHEPMQ